MVCAGLEVVPVAGGEGRKTLLRIRKEGRQKVFHRHVRRKNDGSFVLRLDEVNLYGVFRRGELVQLGVLPTPARRDRLRKPRYKNRQRERA
jgi:hypothetical protein